MSWRPSLLPLLALPPIVVVADQLSKLWVLNNMVLHESFPVISGWFNMTSVRNPGAAFGLFSTFSDTVRTSFLVGVTLLALVLLTVFYIKSKPHEGVARLAASMVVGGAIGNLIDRVRFGEVVDFLDVYVGSHHWPAFNIADSAITIGISLFVWSAWMDGKRAQHAEVDGELNAAANPVDSAIKPDRHKGQR